MSEQETEQEPSIEEILTSIRQIISDDDEESEEAEAPEAKAEEAPVALTEKLDDEPAPEPKAEETPVAAETEPDPIEVEMKDAEPDLPEIDADSLLTNGAEDAAFDAFSELAKKTAIEHSGITIEEIVRSELRPLLKGWLDKHLPTIIERLVQEELERVSKRAMDE